MQYRACAALQKGSALAEEDDTTWADFKEAGAFQDRKGEHAYGLLHKHKARHGSQGQTNTGNRETTDATPSSLTNHLLGFVTVDLEVKLQPQVSSNPTTQHAPSPGRLVPHLPLLSSRQQTDTVSYQARHSQACCPGSAAAPRRVSSRQMERALEYGHRLVPGSQAGLATSKEQFRPVPGHTPGRAHGAGTPCDVVPLP